MGRECGRGVEGRRFSLVLKFVGCVIFYRYLVYLYSSFCVSGVVRV